MNYYGFLDLWVLSTQLNLRDTGCGVRECLASLHLFAIVNLAYFAFWLRYTLMVHYLTRLHFSSCYVRRNGCIYIFDLLVMLFALWDVMRSTAWWRG